MSDLKRNSSSSKKSTLAPANEKLLRVNPDEKILLLDLDETLVHCRPEPFPYPTLAARLTQGTQQIIFYISKRPGVEEFLQKMSKHYTLVLYTSSIKEYAEGILKSLKLDSYFAKVLHRGHCSLNREKKYIKNISILGAELKNMILVDDCIINAENQPDNFLMIEPFKGDENDSELATLGVFLEELAAMPDVRPVKDHMVDFELKLDTDRLLVSPTIERKESAKKFMGKFKGLSKEEKEDLETECEFDGVEECAFDSPYDIQRIRSLSLKTSVSFAKISILSDQTDSLKPSLNNVAFDVKIDDDQIKSLDAVTERVNQTAFLADSLPNMAPKSQYLTLQNKPTITN